MPTVARLNITPVKSTALHHPDRIRLERNGPVGDRAFFFVDGNGKRFSGATKSPILPIRASYDADREWLELRLPNGIVVSGSSVADGRAFDVDFYGRNVPAHEVEGDFTDALSDYAAREVRLARPDRASDALDVRPVTLVSLESVSELAQRGGRQSVDPGRFRMTIEVQGVDQPHEEDTWGGRSVRVGEALLEVEDPVPRCVVTTLDPATGHRDFPTLSVIRQYRGVSRKGNLQFGVYARVIDPGDVRVGDEVLLS